MAAVDGRGGEPGPPGAPGLADRAMDDLRQAAALGYCNPARYRYEPDLAPLRGRRDFPLLMMDLAFPKQPLAP